MSKARFTNIQQLITIIREVGRRLAEAQPKGASSIRAILHSRLIASATCAEHSVGNTVRRVLHNVREEYNSATKGSAASRNVYSIGKFVLQGQPRKQSGGAAKSDGRITLKENDPDDPDSFARALKPVLMEAIQDVLDELETVYDNVSKNAKDHVHSEYVNQTWGLLGSNVNSAQRDHFDHRALQDCGGVP